MSPVVSTARGQSVLHPHSSRRLPSSSLSQQQELHVSLTVLLLLLGSSRLCVLLPSSMSLLCLMSLTLSPKHLACSAPLMDSFLILSILVGSAFLPAAPHSSLSTREAKRWSGGVAVGSTVCRGCGVGGGMRGGGTCPSGPSVTSPGPSPSHTLILSCSSEPQFLCSAAHTRALISLQIPMFFSILYFCMSCARKMKLCQLRFSLLHHLWYVEQPTQVLARIPFNDSN